MLTQQKLDVKGKKRANLFNWRGQFTPELVDYLLKEFGKENQTILDPFVGSGTVLIESGRKNMNSVGFEINPSAYSMAQFYTLLNLSFAEKQEYLNELKQRIKIILADKENLPLWENSEDYRLKYKNLLDFTKDILPLIFCATERILLMNLLFIAENSKLNHLKSTIYNAFDYIEEALLSIPEKKINVEVRLADARATDKFLQNEVDIILTSPPYINVFNYHQNHRAIVEAAGWNILKVAESEIGANRKNRTNRFRTVVQYALDIELALQSFSKSLKNNGLLIMVVGNQSNVRQVPFYNGEMVKDLISELGCFSEMSNHERTFKNKFGNDIKEDIIIASKIKNCDILVSKAKVIAQKHLELGLGFTNEEIQKNEIKDVLNTIDSIKASPILNLNDIFANA